MSWIKLRNVLDTKAWKLADTMINYLTDVLAFTNSHTLTLARDIMLKENFVSHSQKNNHPHWVVRVKPGFAPGYPLEYGLT